MIPDRAITSASVTRKKDGTGTVEVFFERERLLLARLIIEPGCSLARDIHPQGEEGYYVLDGELTVELPERGETVTVKRDEVFFIPENTAHIAANRGCETVHVIAAIGGRVS